MRRLITGLKAAKSFACCGVAVNAHSISTTWTGKKLHGSTPRAESPSISRVAHAFSRELPAAGRIEIRPIGFLRAQKRTIRSGE